MFSCYKLREWVWTETGKGDRLGGDSRVGPSPFSERPAPPHSLHKPHGTRPEAGQLRMPACLCYIFWSALPCLAMPHLPASDITPCLIPYLHCPCVHHPSMCARIIASVCQDCPAGNHTRGLHLSSPCVHLFLHPVHLHPFPCLCLRARDRIEQPGHLFLHKGHFKWPVGRRMACRVRVSCLQQLGYERNEEEGSRKETHKGDLLSRP